MAKTPTRPTDATIYQCPRCWSTHAFPGTCTRKHRDEIERVPIRVFFEEDVRLLHAAALKGEHTKTAALAFPAPKDWA